MGPLREHPPHRDRKRLLLLGCPGSGKTTLAREVACRTGLPLIHLDDEYWGPGWSRPDEADWLVRQAELAAQERWIIEGNYLSSIPIRAARADMAIVVDASAWRCLSRVVIRTVRIRRGDHAGLPARVRDGAGLVRASRDLLPLARKIASFRRRHWWPTVRAARTNPEVFLVIVADAGGHPRRADHLRTQLRRRGLAAAVVPRTEVVSFVCAMTEQAGQPAPRSTETLEGSA